MRELTLRASVMRRNWIVPLVAAGVGLAGILYERVGHPRAPLGYLAAWVAFVLAIVTVARNAFPRARPVSLQVASTGLAIGGEASIPADAILEAKAVARVHDAVDVALTLRARPPLVLRMNRADAEAMASALGVSAGERRATFALMMRLRTRFLFVFGVLGVPWLAVIALGYRGRHFGAIVATVVAMVFLVGPICLLLAWVLGFLRGRLVIGADGFSVKWLARERFVPFADVTRVRLNAPNVARSPTSNDTLVDLASGRRLRLRAHEAPVTRGERFAEARALFEHFVRALERARKRSPDARAAAALLDRGSQSPAAWLLQLDELRQGGAVRYRVAALDPELLADIVSDGSAAASRRAGAAAALARLDDGGRQTVRVAADACAEPKLRAVLLALSEAQSDDAFVDALSRVGASKAP